MKFLNTIDGADKVVTSDAQQFISKAEKDKLTGIQVGALNNPHPETHPYSMITGAPTSLPANGGNALSATHLLGDDTRAVNSPPSAYLNGGARYQSRAGWQTEFKLRTTIDTPPLSGTYVYLKTLTPWSDPSGGYPIQMVYGNGVPHWRVGISTTAWSDWIAVNDGGNSSTVGGFTVGINVPANAKFTDTNTTYSEISEAEINTGTASTLRTITARRITFIINKIKGALTKADVGLGNVDNTSDANKPISTATQTALNGKLNTNHAFTWGNLKGM